METIVLNKRSKKIKWKRIFFVLLIVAATAVCVALNGSFRIRYKYYQVDSQLNRHEVGISAQNNLINKTTIETLDKIKEQGFQVVTYNYDTLIETKWFITFNDTNDETDLIKSTIVDNISIKVYALELTLNNNTYYLPPNQGYKVLKQLQEKNNELENIHLLKGVYINIKEIMTQEAINDLIKNY